MRLNILKMFFLSAIIFLLSACEKQEVPLTKEAVDKIISMFEREQVVFFKENINNIDYINHEEYKVYKDGMLAQGKDPFDTGPGTFYNFIGYDEHESKGFRKQILIVVSKVFEEAGYDFEKTFLTYIDLSVYKYDAHKRYTRNLNNEQDTSTYEDFVNKKGDGKLNNRLMNKIMVEHWQEHPQELFEAGMISEKTAQKIKELMKKK